MPLRYPAVGFKGLGVALPEKRLTNADLEKMVETSDEWIQSRTGIRERRILAEGQTTSDLAAEAGTAAMADAGLAAEDLDLIICATFTPDHICPSTACITLEKMKLGRPIPAFDVQAACSGFVYASTVAAGLIRGGLYRNILVIGVDAMSRFVDFEDRGTCILFGDGAGAVVMGPVEAGKGLLGQSMSADGSGAELIIVPAGGAAEPISCAGIKQRRQFLKMQGNDVYKFATRIIKPVMQAAIDDAGAGLALTDLDLVIPHQANQRIIDYAARFIGIPLDRWVANIDMYGNTSGATIPLAMWDARQDGRLKDNTLFAMVAFGAGLTYGASVWRF